MKSLRSSVRGKLAGTSRGSDRCLPVEEREFRPTGAGVIDLDKPLANLDFGVAASGRLYGSAVLLVRMHGEPLTSVEVQLDSGRIEVEELSQLVWEQSHEEMMAHARTHGCIPANDISLEMILAGAPAGDCPPRTLQSEPAPSATVVVPTARRGDRVVRCLESLAAMNYEPFEILVVDNAPDDPRTRMAVEAFGRRDQRVRYVSEPRPGSSLARNRGLVEARGEIVAFTDDDIIVDSEWLAAMVQPFVADGHVGVVTGLVMPAGFETPAQRSFEECGGFSKGFARRAYDTGANRPSNGWLFPYWGAPFGTGASMAFKRSVLVEIGGFDPALGTGSPALAGADIESFSHALIRGSRLVYEPRATSWHDHRATEGALERQTFTYAVGATAIITKWIMREPRLAGTVVVQVMKLIRAALAGRSSEPDTARFLLKTQMNRGHGRLRRQITGYALGPVLYLRSIAWARRLNLRDVVKNAAAT